jgi:DNA-binding FrmR family transcriptional regulator
MDAIVTEPAEDKLDTFKRVAGTRVSRIMGDLALLEQMSSSPRYQYSTDEVATMLAAIDTATERVRQRFMLAATKVKAGTARKSFHF